jgi:hypothetical protein
MTALILAATLILVSPITLTPPAPSDLYDAEHFPSFVVARHAMGEYVTGIGSRDDAFEALAAIDVRGDHPCYLERMMAATLLTFTLRAFERDEPEAATVLAKAMMTMREVERQDPNCTP